MGVSRRRAQALVSSGQLPAQKLGAQWVVPTQAIRTYTHTAVRRPGRPLSQPGAWAEISQLIEHPPRTSRELDEQRRRVRPRARHLEYYVHPGVLGSVRNHPQVVLSGRDAAQAAGVPVDPNDVDAYVRARDLGPMVQHLRGRSVAEDANLHLHVIADDVPWPFGTGDRYAPGWVAWLDLEDREDRAAVTLLDRLLGGRLRA